MIPLGPKNSEKRSTIEKMIKREMEIGCKTAKKADI
jgi:hypothetical protein